MQCIDVIVNCTHLHHVVYYQNIVAIVDCNHVWSATAYSGLGNNEHKNTTADILIEDQIWPPLDLVTLDRIGKCTNQIHS